jgi:glycosyltransferase involved in cell wall biosynthesis/GT2 family glycosyltransferase
VNVDVVVVSYNSAPHLARALAGIPADATVTVIDNASSDESAAIARRAGAHVVVNETNTGFAAAANQGVRLGHHELVLLLNPDAELGPDTLASLVQALEADPGLAVVSPRLVRPDGTEERVGWPFPSAAGAWREALGLHRLRPTAEPAGFVIGACFLVRRAQFEQVGGFDPRFWLYAEESDLCRRLHDAGWRVGVVDAARATHVGGASSTGIEAVTSEHFARGAELFVRKHDGRAALVGLRAAQVVGSLPRALVLRDPVMRERHRFRLRRAARQLVTHPTLVPGDAPTGAGRATGAGPDGDRGGAADDLGGDLVVCSLEPWDEVWRRNQFLVRELLARDPARRVLFVEPPFDVVHEARRRAGRRRARGLRPLPTDPRIITFEPRKVWPRRAGPLADRSLHRQVRGAAAALGFTAPTLWVNDAHYAGLATEAAWPAVYDITDDWTQAGDGERATGRIAHLERRLFAECARVVVCSPGLAATRRADRPDLVVIPNGVDLEHLTRPRPRPTDLPAGPTAVYVGTLHEDRLDVDLVEQLARARADLQVVLVGPDALGAAAGARLRALPTVHLIGARPYDEVPGYLQHADVVIVPHVVSPFTDSLDPIKAYECLAVGRTTVSTPVAGFRDLRGPVRVADRDAFTATVLAAIDAPDALRPGRPPSWAERAERFDQELRRARTGEAADHPVPRRRVVFVDHCAQISGGELALVRVLPALEAHEGIDAHVILGEHGPLEPRLAAIGTATEVLELDRGLAETRRDEVTAGLADVRRVLAAGRDTWRLRGRLRGLRPDLVHTNSLKAAVYGGVAGRLAGVPVVWHIRDRIADDYLPAPVVTVVRALARTLPHAVITNSQATAATIGPGPARQPRVVIHDVVDEPTERPAVPHEGFRVAMVGRLAPWKGQHVFLDALAAAFGDKPFHAQIVGSALFGEDDYEQQLVDQIDRLGLADRVTRTGFRDDVEAVLAAVDCLVHASVIAEPFGQVVVEGMAMGLPVIAATGGPSEVITDGVDGLLYPPGDTAALAGLLRRVADDPALRRTLGDAARRRARDFTPAVGAARIREVYDRVLDDRAARRRSRAARARSSSR